MRLQLLARRVRICSCALLVSLAFGQPPQHLFIHVKLGPEFHNPVSGRLLVFVAPGTGHKEVDTNPFSPSEVSVAAKEVPSLKPGGTVDVDADDVVFPAPLSQVKPGDYQVQAVLDVAHTYNYVGRTSGDLESDVVTLSAWQPSKADGPQVTLTQLIPADPDPPVKVRPEDKAAFAQALQPIAFNSQRLTQFCGREIQMRGWVVLPPGYASHPEQRYPAVYYTHGFGGNLERIKPFSGRVYEEMLQKNMPEMIWVLLDESIATGTHEFADSVNNGPWGLALVSELIPHLETLYRMDAKSTGRFLQGHSSGGWATLWLQTRYPKVFGGTWSTSPDPSDFHDFTGVNLYGPHANMYRRPDGAPYPLIRDHGEVKATIEQFAKLESVIGPYGGQFASFEWVFSPRAADGQPLPMFDRTTGDVDPAVIAYWHEHYDIAHLVSEHWDTLAPDLRGKIHLIVGTADTFYLDGAAHKLQAVLDGLHAEAHFTFVPDRTHFDLYRIGTNPQGLMERIAAEMYAVARPQGK